MKPTSHIVISFSVSTILYLTFGSYLMAVSSFLFGIFMDIDHFIEYFYDFGFSLNIKRFFDLCTKDYVFKKTFLFLHSWELFLIYSLIVFISPASEILFGVFIGYAFHLVFDQLGNLSKPLSYSFIYRWKNDFLTVKIWHVELLGCK